MGIRQTGGSTPSLLNAQKTIAPPQTMPLDLHSCANSLIQNGLQYLPIEKPDLSSRCFRKT
ncbi:MAG: hypothetical protein JW706_10995, partial [Opitutales bacterium]|nr:hypothetical protein [Opitutales bacterium]